MSSLECGYVGFKSVGCWLEPTEGLSQPAAKILLLTNIQPRWWELTKAGTWVWDNYKLYDS